MEKIKCLECGSGNIAKHGAFYVCENCKTMYRIDNLESGDVADPNDNLFRSSHYSKAGHNPKILADLHLLENPIDSDIRYVIDSLARKTELLISDALDIKNRQTQHKALTDALEEFNTYCYIICEELIKNKKYGFINDETIRLFHKAYIEVYDYTFDSYDYSDRVEEVLGILRYFKILENEFSDKIHRVQYDIRQGKYAGKNEERKKDNEWKKFRFLRGYGLNFNKKYVENHGKRSIIIYFPLVACFVFLLLIIISVTGANRIETILFYVSSTIACGYSVYQIYDYFPQEISICIRTFIWVIILAFTFLDLGTGLFIVWRLIIGIVLCGITYIAFDRYIKSA